MSLSLDSMDFGYLRPPKAVFNITHESKSYISRCLDFLGSYIKKGEGKKSVRKIYHNVPYDDFEMEKIREFREVIQKEGIQLPSW